MAVCNFGSRAESPASSLVLGPVSTPPFCFGARQFLGRGGLCGQPGLDHIPSHEDMPPAHSSLQKKRLTRVEQFGLPDRVCGKELPGKTQNMLIVG